MTISFNYFKIVRQELLQQETHAPSKGFIESVKQSIQEHINPNASSVEKGKQFLKWVVTRLFDVSEDEISNQITDGKDDMGIDAWIKREGEGDDGGIIQLFQFKYGESHDEKEILKFKDDVKSFLKMDTKNIPRDDMKRLHQMIKRENLDYELFYVTNQKIDFKNTPKLKVYGFNQIVDDLWNEIAGLPKGKIEKIKLDQMMNYDNSIIGIVSLAELAKFVHQTGSYIFESNIRKYLKRTKVNKGLRQTLEEDPRNVFYYNNGITMVVKKFKIEGKEVELHEPQIVNGAQTSSTIAEVLPMITNVQGTIQITIITETSQATREAVTRYRNSQNAVKGKDLIALKIYHTRIRGALKQFGYYYEQQAGGWINMEKDEKSSYKGHETYDKYLPDGHDKRIIAKDAIQAMVAGIFQNPTRPYSSIASFMPSGKYYDEIFNSKLKEDYRLLLYPYLVKSYSEKLGYGDPDAEPEQKRYARLLFVAAYFRILIYYIIKKDIEDIKKEPEILEPYFKNFEVNEKLLKFTDEAVEFYFHRSRSYLKQKEIPTWHNFFSKYAWDESLLEDFNSFVVDKSNELKEIKQSFKK